MQHWSLRMNLWRGLLTALCLALLGGCMSVAAIADRAWQQPPHLQVSESTESVRMRVLPGETGVLRGAEGTLSAYALLGQPLLLGGVQWLTGLPLFAHAGPLMALDAILAGFLLQSLPGLHEVRGDALMLATDKGPEFRPLVAQADGALDAHFPASAHRVSGARSVTLLRDGRAMAHWSLPRGLRGVPLLPEQFPVWSFGTETASDAVLVRVVHAGGRPVRDVGVDLAWTMVPPPEMAGPGQVWERLASGDAVVARWPLPRQDGGHLRAWASLKEARGGSWPLGMVDLTPLATPPAGCPRAVVLEPPAFEDRAEGRLATLPVGLAVGQEVLLTRVVIRARSRDPAIILSEPEIELGTVLVESGVAPVGQVRLWRTRTVRGPIGCRLEVVAYHEGRCHSWFEDVWWDDDGR
ncbi:MAG: hypothetical protein VKO64_03420 [Candidatus Sericytochromatia bacterium]|nr:hypothetical protein [Candidatus Sericytochromatia bacterium]